MLIIGFTKNCYITAGGGAELKDHVLIMAGSQQIKLTHQELVSQAFVSIYQWNQDEYRVEDTYCLYKVGQGTAFFITRLLAYIYVYFYTV